MPRFATSSQEQACTPAHLHTCTPVAAVSLSASEAASQLQLTPKAMPAAGPGGPEWAGGDEGLGPVASPGGVLCSEVIRNRTETSGKIVNNAVTVLF